jgi:hypothetical protein
MLLPYLGAKLHKPNLGAPVLYATTCSTIGNGTKKRERTNATDLEKTWVRDDLFLYACPHGC